MSNVVALLGAGMIGSGFAEAWLERGVPLVVWNRSREKAARLGGLGATVAESAAAAVAGAERVHLALSDDVAVDSVLGELLAASALAPDAIVIDHTTTSTTGTRARVERLQREQVAFVHAPVFMSPAMCRERKGIMLLAGPAWLRARVRAALSEMTGELIDLGDRGDLAATYKLFGNVMIISMTAGLSDVFALAKANGVTADAALGLFSKLNVSAIFSARGARMAKGEFLPASFELSMAHKDVRLMLESSGDQALAALPGIMQRMERLLARDLGHLDLGGLAIDATGEPAVGK